MGLFRRRSAPSGPPITAPEHHPPADPPPSPQPEDGSCDPLTDLADLALAHAVRSVVPEGGPLIPFAMVETAEGRSLARFVGELGEAQEKARAHVRTTSSAVRAAVAWDGYLTFEGVRSDALFVEASERGSASIVIAHRYRDAGAGPAEPVGVPMLVDRGAPLF